MYNAALLFTCVTILEVQYVADVAAVIAHKSKCNVFYTAPNPNCRHQHTQV
jgi:hypothetical protein